MQKKLDKMAKENARLVRLYEEAKSKPKEADETMESAENLSPTEEIKDLESQRSSLRQKVKASEDDPVIAEIYEKRLRVVDEKLRSAYKLRNDAKPDHEKLRAADQAIKVAENKRNKVSDKVGRKTELALEAIENLRLAKLELGKLEAEVAEAKRLKEEIAEQINEKPAPPQAPPAPSTLQGCSQILSQFQDMVSLHGEAFFLQSLGFGQTPEEFAKSMAVIKGITANAKSAAGQAAAAKDVEEAKVRTEAAAVDTAARVSGSPASGADSDLPGAATGPSSPGASSLDAAVAELVAAEDPLQRDAIAKRIAAGEAADSKPAKVQRSEA